MLAIKPEAEIVALMLRHGFKDAAKDLPWQHMTLALLDHWRAFDAKESRK